MSCHGYGPVDTGMRYLLRSRRLMNGDDQAPPCPDGLDWLNEQKLLQETSPSGCGQSFRENGKSMVEGEVSTTNSTPRLKIPKSVSFEDSDLSENQCPTAAGLRVNVLEKDTDGTIQQVK